MENIFALKGMGLVVRCFTFIQVFGSKSHFTNFLAFSKTPHNDNYDGSMAGQLAVSLIRIREKYKVSMLFNIRKKNV